MKKLKKHYAPWMFLSVLVIGGFSFATIAQERSTSTLSLAVDRDQDGLSNKEEALYGTNPDQRDTDHDGYSDGVEVMSGYDPLIPASEGDRLIGIGNTRVISGEDIARSRNLTNELRTRVAGIAFDVMSGKEIVLDDVNKEVDSVLNDAVFFDDALQVDVDTIRIKRQDYGDLSKEEREERVRRDVRDYVAALSYLAALYAPQPITTSEDIETFMQQVIAQTEALGDDYTNISYFEQFLPRGEKLLSELRNIEVPEVMLELHIEGLQLAQLFIVTGKSFDDVALSDPAGAAVAFSKVQALMRMAMSFSEKVDEQMAKYNIKL